MLIAAGRLTPIGLGRVKAKALSGVYRQLSELYRCCYSIEQWQAADFKKFFTSEYRDNRGVVLVDDKGVVYGSLLYTREVLGFRIRRIAVWPDYRRLGLAAYMLREALETPHDLRTAMFMARVRPDNLGAIALLESLDFAVDPGLQRDLLGEAYQLFTVMRDQD
jgi:ribosomal protein S18 acetylase RimI-like enzyme